MIFFAFLFLFNVWKLIVFFFLFFPVNYPCLFKPSCLFLEWECWLIYEIIFRSPQLMGFSTFKLCFNCQLRLMSIIESSPLHFAALYHISIFCIKLELRSLNRIELRFNWMTNKWNTVWVEWNTVRICSNHVVYASAYAKWVISWLSNLLTLSLNANIWISADRRRFGVNKCGIVIIIHALSYNYFRYIYYSSPYTRLIW